MSDLHVFAPEAMRAVTDHGWSVRPLKFLFRRGKQLGDGSETLLSVYRDHGVIPKDSRDDNHNRASDDLTKYQLVRRGDLVVNKMKAWQGSVAVASLDGIVSPAYFVYRPLAGIENRYAHYLLRTRDYFRFYAAISSGVRPGQWDLDPAAFDRMPVLLPSMSEQRQIADYLDHETAEIDAFIADLELERALTQEHLVAQREAIFGSYSADAPLAELRSKLFESDVRAGATANSAELLTVSIASGVSPRGEWTSDAHRAEDLTRYKVVRSGDIVLNRMRAFQGAVGVSPIAGITSPDYAVLRCDQRTLVPEFAASIFKSPRFVSEIARRLRGIGNEESGQVRTPRVSVSDLIRIPTRIPLLEEQRAALDEWATQNRAASDVSADIDAAIALAKERRAALITAAVTGQIDVSGFGTRAARATQPAGVSATRATQPAGVSATRATQPPGVSGARATQPAGVSAARAIQPAGVSAVRATQPPGSDSIQTAIDESR
ncbi:restriction endonuclease subunit S [uncultured Microbacterium sp.]|uniref:restriction endonuclease subunit S n=1 Tax=uncultured Microbacterium sp. TaxID=191216 RepID=UPI002632CBDC|nr:restriction endonuclease subunit S [uncultured Microbacterium sp.]